MAYQGPLRLEENCVMPDPPYGLSSTAFPPHPSIRKNIQDRDPDEVGAKGNESKMNWSAHPPPLPTYLQ